MKKKILFIDDDANFLDILRRLLLMQQKRWDMSFVCNVDAALDQIKESDFDAIVSDVNMPGKDGFDLLKILNASEAFRNIPVIIVTGNHESDLKRKSLDLGAADLLNKPFDREELLARIHSALRLKSYQDELKRQNEILEKKVRERTIEVENTRLDIIWRLGNVAEFRDRDTGNHVVRVGCYSRVIAEALGMEQEFVEMLFLISPLHDIGKIGIPDNILLKDGKLNSKEREIMKTHCKIGADIFRQDFKAMEKLFALYENHLHSGCMNGCNPLHEMASTIAMTHHERWDGTGYPSRLSGENIPLESRIVSIADVYDAMCSKRKYKSAYPEGEVLEIMNAEVSRHFDPFIFTAFEKSLDEFQRIREHFADT